MGTFVPTINHENESLSQAFSLCAFMPVAFVPIIFEGGEKLYFVFLKDKLSKER